MDRIRRHVEPGALILMHPTQPTQQALPILLEMLRNNRYTCKTVGQVIREAICGEATCFLESKIVICYIYLAFVRGVNPAEGGNNMTYRRTLSNGVRVVGEEIPSMRSVSIGVWIATGSRYENIRNNGISHFLEHMLFKGTERRTAREIAEVLMALKPR